MTAESDFIRRCASPCSSRAFLALAPETTEEPLLDLTQPPLTNSGVGGGLFVALATATVDSDEPECPSLRPRLSDDLRASLAPRANREADVRLRRELSWAKAVMVSMAAVSERLYKAVWEAEMVFESSDKARLIMLIRPVLRISSV
jgi:hypothetical protein